MPRITDIRPQKRQKRFNIFVDERFAFALPVETLVKEGLQVDQEITPEKIADLVKENELQKIFDKAFKFYSYRLRSRKELDDWFKRKEIGEETQKLVIEKLESLGYLNDEKFAEWWIEQRISFKPISRRLLMLELQQKGIDRALIIKLVNCYIGKETEYELARRLAEKRSRLLGKLPRFELKRKLFAVLARRGFSWEIIQKVVDEIVKSR